MKLTAKRISFLFSLLLSVGATVVRAQSWDIGTRIGDSVAAHTEDKVKLGFEFRSRYESRDGVSFGKDVNKSADLIRTRLGLSYKPSSWLKVSGMLQDSRAPLYGPNAPNTFRDSVDLQESYFELFPESKKGFGMIAGRAMLNYGEARLIGSPQWSNLSRTYDNARVYYRLPKARVEFLLVSPVKIRSDEFNRPVLGDRVWGTYNSFPNLFRKSLVEFYVLRHDQNRIGGFTGGNTKLGTDTLGVNTFGLRATGPLATGLKYSLEGALQTGKIGPAKHRAGAWFSNITKHWNVFGKGFDLTGEYKFASGTSNPKDTTRVGTFDQLYPSNHDKFGHEDLIGWRNIHNVRSLGTLQCTKNFTVNVMYDSFWLASAKDGLYSGAGKSIASSSTGSAGRHVGQEADVFVTYKYKHLQFGAGYGYFFKGEFVRNTTPGVNPTYAYLFQTYSF